MTASELNVHSGSTYMGPPQTTNSAGSIKYHRKTMAKANPKSSAYQASYQAVSDAVQVSFIMLFLSADFSSHEANTDCCYRYSKQFPI